MHRNWMHHKNESKDSLKELWKISDGYKSSYEPNVESGLKQLKFRIAQDQQTTAKVVSMSRKTWLPQMAAAIALLITATFLFQLWTTNTVEWQQIATTEAVMEDIALPDGSIVWVNKHSQLSFPATFGTERIVKLEGEAFFKVAKDATKPFKVITSEGTIKVLGTEFNVRAYTKETKTIVEVEEGSVLLTLATINQQKKLQANDKIIYDKASATLSKVEPIEWKDIAWKAKQLSFSDESIPVVLDYLKDNFAIEVDYATAALANCPLNATLVKNDPTAILKQVKSAFPSLQLKRINSTKYQLSGSCN